MNLQNNNVGNVGDIHKHAGLYKFAELIRERNPKGKINYFDSHTYLVEGELSANGLCDWKKYGSEVAEKYPFYLDIEREYLKSRKYLCSTGVVLYALNEDIRLYLSERDAATRIQLEHQLRDYSLQAEIVASDFNEYLSLSDHMKEGPCLSLIDPFYLKKDEWQNLWSSASQSISALTGDGCDGIVLCYRYKKLNDKPIHWPKGEGNYSGPVAFYTAGEQGEHNYAVYATESIVEDVLTSAKSLGWETEQQAEKSQFENTIVIGVDVAWGGFNPNGYSCWSPTEEIFFPTGGTISGLDNVKNRILNDSEDKDLVIISLDGPVQCKRETGETGRSWERLFSDTQGEEVSLGALPTHFSKYESNATADIRNFLDDYGFQDISRNISSFMKKAKSGVLKGKFYLETYPNPTGWALLGSSKKKFKINKPQGHQHLLEVSSLIQEFVGQNLFGGSHSLDKDLEDKLDSVLCLLIPLIMLNVYKSGLPLYHIGGKGKSFEEGCIFTLLNRKDEKALAQNDQEAIMTCLKSGQINPTAEQKKVIECESPVVRVVARAGSGKTTTMVQKARYIVEKNPKAKVLLLTFTRNAADDINKALDRQLSDSRMRKRCQAATYHGYAFRSLIKSSIDAEIWPQPEECTLLNEIGRNSVLEYLGEIKGWNKEFDGWKEELTSIINKTDPQECNQLEDLMEVARSQNIPGAEKLALIWPQLLALYRKEKILDFDIIMTLNELLLKKAPSYLKHSRGDFSHIVADEFQDTNWPQLRSLYHICGLSPGMNKTVEQFCVIGDDFQTIYEWRGAVKGIFDHVQSIAEKNQLECTTLSLPHNWRSLPPIVSNAGHVAQELIQHEEHKNLAASIDCQIKQGRPGHPSMPEVTSYSNELEAVQVLLERYEGAEIAVLARKNATLSAFAAKLAEAGIPSSLLGSRPEEAPGFCLFHAALSILFTADKPQLSCWWEWVKFEKSISPSVDSLAIMQNLWGQVDISCGSRQLNILQGAGAVCLSLTGILESFLSNQNLYHAGVLVELLNSLAERFTVIEQEKDLCLRLVDFLEGAFAVNGGDDPERILSESTRKDFVGGNSTPDAISLSTIHGFKGLEKPAVVLIDDGFMNNMNPEDMRIDYVARTRARNQMLFVGAGVGKECKSFDNEIENLKSKLKNHFGDDIIMRIAVQEGLISV